MEQKLVKTQHTLTDCKREDANIHPMSKGTKMREAPTEEKVTRRATSSPRVGLAGDE